MVAVANSQHLIVQLRMILINIARYAMQSPFEVLIQSGGSSVHWPYGSTSRSGDGAKGAAFYLARRPPVALDIGWLSTCLRAATPPSFRERSVRALGS